MKKAVIIYNLILACIITIAGVINAKTPSQLFLSLAFLPVAIFFAIKLFKRSKPAAGPTKIYPLSSRIKIISKQRAKLLHPKEMTDPGEAIDPEILDHDRQAKVLNRMGINDADRRIFLKFVGSSSIAVFLLAIFTKQARSAFFGSIPGPGSVSIKDSSGNIISPAEKQPTDGYEVSEIDDLTTTTYYGFVHRDGSWYITRESGGSYRYVRGSSGFAANWTGRTALSYNTYDTVF